MLEDIDRAVEVAVGEGSHDDFADTAVVNAGDLQDRWL